MYVVNFPRSLSFGAWGTMNALTITSATKPIPEAAAIRSIRSLRMRYLLPLSRREHGLQFGPRSPPREWRIRFMRAGIVAFAMIRFCGRSLQVTSESVFRVRSEFQILDRYERRRLRIDARSLCL